MTAVFFVELIAVISCAYSLAVTVDRFQIDDIFFCRVSFFTWLTHGDQKSMTNNQGDILKTLLIVYKDTII